MHFHAPKRRDLREIMPTPGSALKHMLGGAALYRASAVARARPVCTQADVMMSGECDRNATRAANRLRLACHERGLTLRICIGTKRANSLPLCHRYRYSCGRNAMPWSRVSPLDSDYTDVDNKSGDSLAREPKFSSFLRGYSGCLTLRPSRERRELRFQFRGKDLATITVAEALGEDWKMVGQSIQSALAEHEEKHEEAGLSVCH